MCVPERKAVMVSMRRRGPLESTAYMFLFWSRHRLGRAVPVAFPGFCFRLSRRESEHCCCRGGVGVEVGVWACTTRRQNTLRVFFLNSICMTAAQAGYTYIISLCTHHTSGLLSSAFYCSKTEPQITARLGALRKETLPGSSSQAFWVCTRKSSVLVVEVQWYYAVQAAPREYGDTCCHGRLCRVELKTYCKAFDE